METKFSYLNYSNFFPWNVIQGDLCWSLEATDHRQQVLQLRKFCKLLFSFILGVCFHHLALKNFLCKVTSSCISASHFVLFTFSFMTHRWWLLIPSGWPKLPLVEARCWVSTPSIRVLACQQLMNELCQGSDKEEMNHGFRNSRFIYTSHSYLF